MKFRICQRHSIIFIQLLGCTEIFVQTPTSLLLQSQLYSSCKSNTTLKGLIGITPHGAISFISSLYTGSISDKEITRCSRILNLLEHGDSVMADKGFNIDDLLKENGVGLNIPPFLQSQAQFSAQDVHETKTIAKLRIHVERAIRRIKEFHFFWFRSTSVKPWFCQSTVHCSLPTNQFSRTFNFK